MESFPNIWNKKNKIYWYLLWSKQHGSHTILSEIWDNAPHPWDKQIVPAGLPAQYKKPFILYTGIHNDDHSVKHNDIVNTGLPQSLKKNIGLL